MNIESRIYQIFNILSNSSNFVTSSEIANKLNVSDRTIKSDMKSFASLCVKHGAKLISFRGKGYKLEIFNDLKYNTYKFYNEVSNFFLYNSSMQFSSKLTLSLLQYLIIQENKYTNVQELSEKFYMSETSIKTELSNAKKFFEFFDIYKYNYGKSGFRFIGDEVNVRICMLRLYGLFYDKLSYESDIEEFSKYFKTDLLLVNKIRKKIIKNIRKHNLILWDVSVQYISRYIALSIERNIDNKIVTYNSMRNNNLKNFSITFKASVDIARDIETIYKLSSNEIEIIQELLIIFCENDSLDFLNREFKQFYSDSEIITENFMNTINQKMPGVSKLLEVDKSKILRMVLMLLLKKIFLFKFFETESNLFQVQNKNINFNLYPLSYIFSKELILSIIKITKLSFNIQEQDFIINTFSKFIASINFKCSKLNIAISSSDFIQTKNIESRILEIVNHNMINSIDSMPLYEGRYKNDKKYDIYILDKNLEIAYRYKWEMVAADINSDQNYNTKILNKILELSYDVDKKIIMSSNSLKVNVLDIPPKNIESYYQIKSNIFIILEVNEKNLINLYSKNNKYFIEINKQLNSLEDIKISNIILSYIINKKLKNILSCNLSIFFDDIITFYYSFYSNN